MPHSIHDLLQEAVDAIHFLHAQGWAPATSSNYSVRDPQTGTIWISASGLDKGGFSVGDFVAIDPEGKPIQDTRKTSAETQLHTMLYREFPDTGCILHTHSVLNNVLSKALEAQGHILFEGNELQKAISGYNSHEDSVQLPIFSNSQDIPALALDILKRRDEIAAVPGFVLAAHGLYTWGATVAAAKRHIEAFEFLFSYYYHLHQFQS